MTEYVSSGMSLFKEIYTAIKLFREKKDNELFNSFLIEFHAENPVKFAFSYIFVVLGRIIPKDVEEIRKLRVKEKPFEEKINKIKENIENNTKKFISFIENKTVNDKDKLELYNNYIELLMLVLKKIKKLSPNQLYQVLDFSIQPIDTIKNDIPKYSAIINKLEIEGKDLFQIRELNGIEAFFKKIRGKQIFYDKIWREDIETYCGSLNEVIETINDIISKIQNEKLKASFYDILEIAKKTKYTMNREIKKKNHPSIAEECLFCAKTICCFRADMKPKLLSLARLVDNDIIKIITNKFPGGLYKEEIKKLNIDCSETCEKLSLEGEYSE